MFPYRQHDTATAGKAQAPAPDRRITPPPGAPGIASLIGTITPLTGKCWTMPVVANGRLFCRSTKEIVALRERMNEILAGHTGQDLDRIKI